MGKSRFKTAKQLLIEKAGPIVPENDENKYIKERGNRIETVVREFLEGYNGYSLSPANFEHVRFGYLRASLDGVNTDRKIITEIKLLSSQSLERFNRNTEGYQKFAAAKLQGIVPPEYMPQIQHQLFITGYDTCIFAGACEIRGKALDGDSIAQVIVERDEKYIRELLQKEFDFWLELDKLIYTEGELE
jgi:putative phage-type endonuclease